MGIMYFNRVRRTIGVGKELKERIFNLEEEVAGLVVAEGGLERVVHSVGDRFFINEEILILKIIEKFVRYSLSRDSTSQLSGEN